jgi:hypothetical protein
MVSWGELFKGVNIVLTANPDGGTYIVTSLDPAKLSRFRSITLKKDVGAWSRWAEDHKVDHRLIKYLLRYPEMLSCGERTNPRTWVQAGGAFKVVPEVNKNDRANWRRFSMLIRSAVDDDAASGFINFITEKLGEIVDADEVLNDFESVKEKLSKFVTDSNIPALNVTTERIFNKITNAEFTPGTELKKYITNFQKYILMDKFPQDMRFALVQRIFMNKNNRHSNSFIKNDKLIECLSSLGV